MLDHRKDVEHVLLSEGRLVAAVKAVLLQQNLGTGSTTQSLSLGHRKTAPPQPTSMCPETIIPRKLPSPALRPRLETRAHLDPGFQGDLSKQCYLLQPVGLHSLVHRITAGRSGG